MRIVCLALVIFALLSLLAPTPAHADMEARIKKLEAEVLSIKESSEAILHRIEASIRRLESAPKSDAVSFLSSLPSTVASTAESIYDSIVHHGGAHAARVQKEYPKWLKWGQKQTKDLPALATSTLNLVQRDGGKYYSQFITWLSGFLTSQGVPQQYVVMATQGVVALVVVAAILITFTILVAVCGCLASVCCGSGRRREQTQTARRKERRAASQLREQQHQQSHGAQTTGDKKPTNNGQNAASQQ